MFRHWCQYLHQAAHKVKVHTDHANLLFWKNPGDHNRRVARWHTELMEYDFELCTSLERKMDVWMHCQDGLTTVREKKITRIWWSYPQSSSAKYMQDSQEAKKQTHITKENGNNIWQE